MCRSHVCRCVLSITTLLLLALSSGCSSESPILPTADVAESLQGTLGTADASSKWVIPPSASPGGRSYAEWSTLWWQWMASAPALPNQNPTLDDTGALISYGQSGHVWFLAPNAGGVTVRTGTVPTGTMLLFSPIAIEASSREGNGDTLDELRASAAAVADYFEVTSFEIDGQAIPIGPEFRVQSPDMFSLTVPEDNVFDYWGVDTPAGTYYPSISDGYFIMIAPLAAGHHTIRYVGGIPAFDYHQDVTFELTVVGGGRGNRAVVP